MNITASSFTAKRRAVILQAIGVAALSLGLAACSKSLSGTYTNGKETLEFLSDNKVVYSGQAGTYSMIDDKRVSVNFGKESFVLNIASDGSISGDILNGVFKKK